MSILEKARKKFYGDSYEAVRLEKLLAQSQPHGGDFAVCFYAHSPLFFSKGGKVTAFDYLPAFCDHIRTQGVPTFFASTKNDLKSFTEKRTKTVLVNVYKEVGFTPKDPEILALIDQADIVFNHPNTGRIIFNKMKTHSALASVGCNVPTLAGELEGDAKVFSNEMSSTAAPAFTTTAKEAAGDDRFNAKFIDTRMAYGEKQYFTTMRLMCINDRITHAFMRARDTDEDNPSVHAANTPQDADLLNHLWQEAMSKYKDQFQTIADKVFEACGNGFYGHDTLIDQDTETVYICETTFKFDDLAYQQHLSEVKGDVVGLEGHTSAFMSAQSAAPIFLDFVRRSLAS